MTSSSSSSVRAHPTRLTPPTLFQGPPSRNASTTSVLNPPSGAAASTQNTVNAAQTTLPPPPTHHLLRTRSKRIPDSRPGTANPINSSSTATSPLDTLTPSTTNQSQSAAAAAAAAGGAGPETTNTASAARRPRASTLPRNDTESRNAADRTDALWSEMQSTLEEVELSAAGRTHVFGAEHARALEGLRVTQLALAQAWARNEGDEAGSRGSGGSGGGEPTSSQGGSGGSGGGDVKSGDETGPGGDQDGGLTKGGEGDDEEGEGANIGGGNGLLSADGPGGASEGAKNRLEEETENDVLMARKRREANDRYFQRVNAGVLDVVRRLEDVAASMSAVEQESRDIWGDGDSVDESLF
ncbi:MAG: hypothetical protein M1819_001973 [Sarea resinae]|nr:MAG: hypothetical protein M1819_001973 [Sarea resinae]